MLSKVKYLYRAFGILCAILVFSGVFLFGRETFAASNTYLNFQGRLTNSAGNLVADGYYNLRFKIYDGGTQGGPSGTGEANSGTGGTYLWTETFYDSNGGTAGNDNRVRVVNGYFSVSLGSQTAFPSTIDWSQELWLTMDVGGSTQTATPTFDGEMVNPTTNIRIRLTAVPHAFSANELKVTSSGITNKLVFATPSASNKTITIPNETGTVCTTGSICTGYQGSLSFSNGLTESSGAVTLGGTLTSATTLAAGNANSLALTSTLSGGARSTALLSLTQANDATNNSSAVLFSATNSDTATTAAVASITQSSTAAANALTISTSSTTTAITVATPAGGVAYTATGVTSGTAIAANTVTTGNGIQISAITTGNGLNLVGTGLTTGNGILLNTTSNALTSGKAISITGAASTISADFSGAYINVTPTRTNATASATRTDSGNFLNLTRANTVNATSAVYNITGSLANLQSNCTQTLGTCNDSAVLLNLNQQYASASGAIINVTGAGTGNLATLDASNASANGVSIDIQSSSSSQFALKATSNNGSTNGLYVRGDGYTGIGTTSPNTQLSIYNANESATLTNFTQAVTDSGLNILTDWVAGTYTSGIFWSSSNNNATKPKAGIWTWQDNSGQKLLFGTSNSYATGITNTALTIDPSGNVGVGDTSPAAMFTVGSGDLLQVASTGATTISPTANGAVALTVNGTTGTAGNAINVVQSGAATGIALSTTSTGTGQSVTLGNTSGTQTDGLIIERNGTGGATTNLLNLTQTAGTATNGITFAGTFTKLLNSTNFNITNAGDVSTNGGYTQSGTTANTLTGSLTLSGAQFTNNASTLNTAQSLGDFATGGAIGTAATTVDVDTSFAIAQATAGQTLSLPSPTVTTAGRVVFVLNTGSTSFTMHSVTIPNGYGQIYIWNGTSWILGASGGGSAITLQSAYDGGNTLTTTDARNIAVTLANTATDANFLVNIATSSTGRFAVQNNGTDVLGVTSSALTVDVGSTFNQDIVMGSGDQIDFADEVADKVYWYSNTYGTGIEASTLTNWSASQFRWKTGGTSASTGTEQMLLSTTGLTLAGDLDVDGGDITTGATTFNLLNSTATTVNAFGAATSLTLGATSGTAIIQNTTTRLSNANAVLGIGTTSPQGTIDLGSGTAGKSITWAGTTGTTQVASIGTSYSSGDLNFLQGLELGTASDTVTYSYTATYAPSGIRTDFSTGDILFFNAASAVQTAGTSFDYSANTKLIVRASGNVGIGTLTPSTKLHLNRDDTTRTDFRIENDDNTTGQEIGLIEFTALDSLSASTTYSRIIGVIDNATDTAEQGRINFEQLANGVNAVQMVLDGSNLGIGDTTPAAMLTVGNGDLFQVSSGGNVTIGSTSGTGLNFSNTGLTTDINLQNGATIHNDTAGIIYMGGLIQGGFGASSTAGTLDWNDTTNAISGNGKTLLLGSATNGPGDGVYYHPFNFEYASKDGSGNITQLAIPYGYSAGINAGIKFRGRFSGTWSNWVNIVSSDTSGNYTIGNGTGTISIQSSNIDVSSAGAISNATGVASSGNIDFSALNAGGIVKAAVTTGRLSIATAGTDYENPLTFNNGLTRSTNTVTLGGSLNANTTIDAGNARTLNVTSTLTGGARSTAAFNISQANDATNNNSSNLFTVTNADTGSTASAMAAFDQQANGLALQVSSAGTAVQLGGNYLIGLDVLAPGGNTGIRIGNITTGTGLLYQGNSGSAAFTGAIVDLTNNARNVSSGTLNDTGNFLRVGRANTTSGTGALTVSGALVSFTSNCTQTAGTCTDTANILSLTQSYASASGAVINVSGVGTGNLATLDATNASANGVSIDVQSSSSSQYALNVTSNNGSTTGLYVRADGNVGIGDTTPAYLLTVGNGDTFGVNATGSIYGNSKEALRTNDAWLRINPANDFTSGIYAGSGIFRTDGNLQVGSSGSAFNVTSSGNTTIGASSGTGLNFSSTGITTDINLQNGETIDNNVDGTIAVTATDTNFSGNLTVRNIFAIGASAADSNYNYQGVVQWHSDSPDLDGAYVVSVPDIGPTMMNIKITGYNYDAVGAWEVVVGGYWTASAWVNPSVEFRGSAPFDRVRLMINGTTPVIVLGDDTDLNNWDYPQIDVDLDISGYSAQSSYFSGWSGALVTDVSTYTADEEPAIRFYQASNGNIGIGDVTPAALLTVGSGDLFQVSSAGVVTYVNGTTNTTTYVCRNSSGQLAACNTTGTGAAFIQGGNSFGAQAVLGTNDNNSLAFRTNNGNRLVLDAAGSLAFQQASTISTSTGAMTLQPASGSNLNVTLATTGDFVVNTNQLYVDTSTARVGIGTAAPAGKLEVYSDVGRFGRFSDAGGNLTLKVNDNSSQNVLTLENTTNGTNFGASILFNLGYGGGASAAGTTVNAAKIAVNAEQNWTSTASTQDSYLAISTTLDGTLTERLRVASSGYVGIGTTAPNSDLHVSRDVAASTAIAFAGGSDATGTANTGTGSVANNAIAVSGNYAYIGKAANSGTCSGATVTGCEFAITDISNPAVPVATAGLDFKDSVPADVSVNIDAVAVSGNYAYVGTTTRSGTCNPGTSTYTGCELMIIDISNAASPTVAYGVDVNSGGVLSVFVKGNNLFITKDGSTSSCSSAPQTGCELQVFNISTPTAPVYMGGADASGTTNSGATSSNFNSVQVVGRYAYIAKANSATACSSAVGCELQIYDVLNPAAPTYVGGGDATGTANSGTGNVAFSSIHVAGNYAYIAKAASATDCSTDKSGCELQIWNVTNPTSPTLSASADAGATINSGTVSSAFNNVTISGNFAYIVKTNSGTACSGTPSAVGCEIQIYNITTPASPTYAGGIDVTGAVNSGTGNTAFNDVVVSGNYLYVNEGANANNCTSAVGCELQVYSLGTADNVNRMNIARSDSINSTAGNVSIVNPLANFQSQCTQTAGNCNDTANVLAVSQQFTGSTGAVLSVSGAGYGDLISATDSSSTLFTVFRVMDTGKVLFQNSVDSTKAFSIDNATGLSLFNVDTTNTKITLSADTVAYGTPAQGANATGTTSGTGTNTTTLVITADIFSVNDVLYIDNAGQDYYTRVTADAGTGSYTVSPAVTFENARTVTKYFVQNLGATSTDYASLNNRFFQGYFLGGVVTGTGSTTLSDGNLDSTGNLVLQRSNGGNVGIQETSPIDLLHVTDTSAVVSTTQLTLESRYNGYGAGIDFVSRTSSGGTRLSMAKITADGESSWTTTGSTQDAGLRFFTTLDGTQLEKMRLNANGDLSVGFAGSATSIGSGYASIEARGTNGGGIGMGTSGARSYVYANAGAMYYQSPSIPMYFSTDGGSTYGFEVHSTGLTMRKTSAQNLIGIVQDGSTRSLLGVAYTAGDVISGSAAYDTVFRTQGYNMLFSVNSGSTAALKIDTSQNSTFAGTVSATKVYASNPTSSASVYSVCWSGANEFAIQFNVTCPASSDARLKTNINSLDNALDRLAQLRGVSFNWADQSDPYPKDTQYGVIAQDVMKAFPELVGTAKVPFKGSTGEYYTVNYMGLIGPVIQGVNLLNEKTEQLKVRQNNLEARISALEQGSYPGNLTVAGNAVFSGNLKVNGSTELADLKVNGKTEVVQLKVSGQITSEGEAPIPTVEIPAGTPSTPAIDTTVDVDGNDVAGKLTIKTLNTTLPETRIKVKFNKPYGKAPVINITPVGKESAKVVAFVETTSADEVIITFVNPLTNNQTYEFNYQIIQANEKPVAQN